jgi:hypothetical protein
VNNKKLVPIVKGLINQPNIFYFHSFIALALVADGVMMDRGLALVNVLREQLQHHSTEMHAPLSDGFSRGSQVNLME